MYNAGKERESMKKKQNSYEKAIARMELEAKRAQAQVMLLKALYRELQEVEAKKMAIKA